MTEPCLELVVFKVKDADKARIARRSAQETVRFYDGFLSWTAYESCEDTGLFADIVFWKDLASAKAAAAKIAKDPAFSAVLAEIDGILTISHYTADRTVDLQANAA